MIKARVIASRLPILKKFIFDHTQGKDNVGINFIRISNFPVYRHSYKKQYRFSMWLVFSSNWFSIRMGIRVHIFCPRNPTSWFAWFVCRQPKHLLFERHLFRRSHGSRKLVSKLNFERTCSNYNISSLICYGMLQFAKFWNSITYILNL